jgi:hypothetical protein
MCRELRNEIQKKYREVAEKPRGNLRTTSKSGADGRIRTGDPLFTNQDLGRPLGAITCYQVPFRIRPPEISCR